MQRSVNVMPLLERLWRRLLRRAANAMRILGRMIQCLLKAADKGCPCDTAGGVAIVAADEGDYGKGRGDWYNSGCVLVYGHLMVGVFDSMDVLFDMMVVDFNSEGVRFHGHSV